MIPLKTAFIGTGNVAWTLVPALDLSPEVDLRWIVSRNGTQMPVSTDVEILSSPEEIPDDADLILVSVKDDAVNKVIDALGNRNAIIAHTSGSIPMPDVTGTNKYGVFYPLQTFSKGKTVSLDGVPFLIEGSAPVVTEALISVVDSLGGKPVISDSDKRRVIHLAAVFACNFVNNMWATAEDILAPVGENLELLEPLLCETLRKALASGAENAQTGPARRGDVEVEQTHLQLLDDQKAELYKIITRSIAKRYEQNSI